LIGWYNNLIDKSVDELSVTDVSKMIRQDILKDLAVDRAIELFLSEPFASEMQDGDLLALLASNGSRVMKSDKVQAVIAMMLKLENEIEDFDWVNESSKTLFEENLAKLEQILS
jgi:hypothetical protein